jgi:hypothetical protein
MTKKYSIQYCVNGEDFTTLVTDDKQQAENFFNNVYKAHKDEGYPFFIIMRNNENKIIDKIIILNNIK